MTTNFIVTPIEPYEVPTDIKEGIHAVPSFVYSIKFYGHYPVGACGIVTAEDLTLASESVRRVLEDRGLLEDNVDIFQELAVNFIPVITTRDNVEIILDGNY